MNLAITLARKGGNFTVITGPEVPIVEQTRAFHKLLVDLAGQHDELQVWSSTGGCIKKQRIGATDEKSGVNHNWGQEKLVTEQVVEAAPVQVNQEASKPVLPAKKKPAVKGSAAAVEKTASELVSAAENTTRSPSAESLLA